VSHSEVLNKLIDRTFELAQYFSLQRGIVSLRFSTYHETHVWIFHVSFQLWDFIVNNFFYLVFLKKRICRCNNGIKIKRNLIPNIDFCIFSEVFNVSGKEGTEACRISGRGKSTLYNLFLSFLLNFLLIFVELDYRI
jgi:hypothetical protein